MKAALLYFAATLPVLVALVGSAVSGLAQAPADVSFSPVQGPVGTWVEINGTGISPATAVEFNGVSAEFTTILIPRLGAKVPQGATTGPITVRTPGGAFTTVENFQVLATPPPPQPVILSFSPASGAPGEHVIVSGDNLTSATAVKFNGVDAYFSTGRLLRSTDRVFGPEWQPVSSPVVEHDGWSVVAERATHPSLFFKLEATGSP